ncbi:MAG: phospholipase D-like domain-containing protein [Roseiarcus sp.]|jgi:phosphatidylserine/phosphatidylglycerophosphate/cardiolipin synthase-like enzyme
MEALFASLHGGETLRGRLLGLVAEASALAAANRVDLHVMTFAFTDEELAEALAQAAARRPTLTVRIIADWSQRTRARGQQVGRLTRLGLSNLDIRYKKDQPYVWDAAAGHMRWSYNVSRGLLHHKTLGVLANGRPWRLACGSFNWTASAARSYENLMIVTPERMGPRRLMARVELEFEALWSNGGDTLSAEEAGRHYQAIVDAYRRDPSIAPVAIQGVTGAGAAPLRILDPEEFPTGLESECMESPDEPPRPGRPRVEIAFSARGPEETKGRRGYADCNRAQRFLLRTASGKAKRVPLTITNLALDTIFGAAPGQTLKIAMYGLSARVAEYNALLDAARRGVRVLALLDRAVGSDVVARLAAVGRLENLTVEVRTAGRMMHQKYVVLPESSTVLTGTANMTTDASARHSEHRIRVSGDPALAAQFSADFDTIWNRLRPMADSSGGASQDPQLARSQDQAPENKDREGAETLSLLAARST